MLRDIDLHSHVPGSTLQADLSSLQAIRGQLQAIAASRDRAASCDAENHRLLEDTLAALAEVDDIADQQPDLSCLRQARASQECKLTTKRLRLQVQFTALNSCTVGMPGPPLSQWTMMTADTVPAHLRGDHFLSEIVMFIP